MIHRLSKHCANTQKEELGESILSPNKAILSVHMIIGSALFPVWQIVKEDLEQ